MELLTRRWGRTPKTMDEDGNYRCSSCSQWKPPSDFSKNKTQRSGLNYMCKPCSRARVRAYNLPLKYGITAGKFAEMLMAQGGKCACCGEHFEMEGRKNNRPCVDHNHKTGEVRSLLCGRCNLAAGNVLDSSDMAKKLVAYLEHWNC